MHAKSPPLKFPYQWPCWRGLCKLTIRLQREPRVHMGRSWEVRARDDHSWCFLSGLRAMSTTLYRHYRRRFNLFQITKHCKDYKGWLRLYCLGLSIFGGGVFFGCLEQVIKGLRLEHHGLNATRSLLAPGTREKWGGPQIP